MDSRRRADYAQLESNDPRVTWLAQRDKVPWYSKPNLRLLYLFMLPACLGVEMTFGFDSSMINGLQSISSWLEYYHHPRSALLGFMVAAYSLGFSAAIPFTPFIVDKMGRRYPILLGGIISIIGAIIQGSALNASMFIISRFILGVPSAFSIVAASSLIAELSHPNERAVMGSLFAIPYDLGSVAAASLILRTFVMTNNWGWRIPSYLQAVPSLFQVTFIWFLPESPRWLVSKGRGIEAFAILVKYHAEGNEDSDFVKTEYTQIKETLEAEQKTSDKSWKEVFSTLGMRKRVAIAIVLGLSSNWCGSGLIFYFLPSVLDSIGIHDNRSKNIINLARASWGLITSTICAFIAPRYPRRSVFLTSTISLFVVFTAWTVASAEYSLTHSKISAQIVLVLIFLFILAHNLGSSVMVYTFLVELFPFHVRAKGLSIFQWCARVGGFISLVMNPIGIEAVGWKWYIVYCLWNAFQVVFVYLMFPETSGRTLEELTFLYESDQVVFRHRQVESPSEHEENRMCYGTMEDNRRGSGP